MVELFSSQLICNIFNQISRDQLIDNFSVIQFEAKIIKKRKKNGRIESNFDEANNHWARSRFSARSWTLQLP